MSRASVSSRDGIVRAVLLLLLLANTVMELGGGVMMIAEPGTVGADTFGVPIANDAMPLVALIGGATLSYALVSATATMGVLKRRAWAPLTVLLLGAMLIIVGGVMFGHGMRIGGFDLAKGFALMIGGLLYWPSPVRAGVPTG
jgi:hypothetical protein